MIPASEGGSARLVAAGPEPRRRGLLEATTTEEA